MLESLLGSHDRPFPATPRPDRFLPIGPAGQARQELVRVIERAEGPAVLIGSCGLGKTILCQVLEAQFQSRFQTVLLSCARLTSRRALFQHILFGLNRPYRSLDEAEARLAVIDHIQDVDRCPAGVLLIVDEAQHLAPRLFDELRVLAGLSRHGQPLVRLVISGTPALEERLARAYLEAFDQRVAARVYLSPLHKHEITDYLRRELGRVGVGLESCFAADAIRAIETLSAGIVRLVHQLADHALVLAVADGEPLPLGEGTIQAAWADLQQLPFPTPGAAEGATRPDMIEFGPLGIMPEVKSSLRLDAREAGTERDQASCAMLRSVMSGAEDDMTGLLDDIEDLISRDRDFSSPVPSAMFDPFEDRETEYTLAVDHADDRDDAFDVDARDDEALDSLADEPIVREPSPLDAAFEIEEAITEVRRSDLAATPRIVKLESEPVATHSTTPSESSCGYSAHDLIIDDTTVSPDAMVQPETVRVPTAPAIRMRADHVPPRSPMRYPLDGSAAVKARTESDELELHDSIRAVRPDILRIVPSDDRDLILIEDEAESASTTPRPAGSKRANLRQLFADMRKS